MNFIQAFIVALFVLVLAACGPVSKQYAYDSGMVAVESSTLRQQYSNVERLLRQVQADKHMFDEQEWRELNNIDASIDMLIMKYDALSRFKTPEISIPDIQFMYHLAAESYTRGRQIIYNHWDEFQPSTQLMLSAFDKQAEETSGRIQHLINNPSNKNINEALTLISGIVSVAVKMLGASLL